MCDKKLHYEYTHSSNISAYSLVRIGQGRVKTNF